MRLRDVNIYVPMVDLMTCTLMTVFIMFIAALAEVKPDAKPTKPTIETEGLFVVIMEWPADSSDDIDLYMMNPEQETVFFGKANVGLMHLERDDRGRTGDMVQKQDGTTVTVDRNEERIIIRGVIPGEYVVNVHVYAKSGKNEPVPVTVTLYRLVGEDQPLAHRELILTHPGEEQTAFRMTIDDQELVSDVNHLQRSIVGQAEEDTEGVQ